MFSVFPRPLKVARSEYYLAPLYLLLHNACTVGVINFFELHGHTLPVDGWVRRAFAEIFSPFGSREGWAAES